MESGSRCSIDDNHENNGASLFCDRGIKSEDINANALINEMKGALGIAGFIKKESPNSIRPLPLFREVIDSLKIEDVYEQDQKTIQNTHVAIKRDILSEDGTLSFGSSNYVMKEDDISGSSSDLFVPDSEEMVDVESLSDLEYEQLEDHSNVNRQPKTKKCAGCDAFINSSKMYNMISHIRRHVEEKQYHCHFCKYEHNEKLKVKSHMNKAHPTLERKEPLDGINAELQRKWDEMLKQCFPDVYKTRQVKLKKKKEISKLSSVESHRCILCRTYFARDDALSHILGMHNGKHVSKGDRRGVYSCIKCTFLASSQCRLRRHLKTIHQIDQPYPLRKIEHISERNVASMLYMFFPTIGSAEGQSMTSISSENTAANNIDITTNENRQNGSAQSSLNSSTEENNSSGRSVNDMIQQLIESDQYSEIGEDNHNPINLVCQCCANGNIYSHRNSIYPFIYHAKSHCVKKQFACSFENCTFTTNTRMNCVKHLKFAHNSEIEPKAAVLNDMADRWKHCLNLCFPQLIERSKNIRFGSES